MQDVETNHAGVEVAVITHNRISLSNYDNIDLNDLRINLVTAAAVNTHDMS